MEFFEDTFDDYLMRRLLSGQILLGFSCECGSLELGRTKMLRCSLLPCQN